MTLIALTSYSIYLFHGVVGWTLLFPIFYADPSHSYVRALALAILLTAVSVVIVYNLVERPSKWLAKRLTQPRTADPHARVRDGVQRGARVNATPPTD